MKPDAPYDQLERIFHEPGRLAIMSALCAASGGVAFSDLKRECNLTDGNLNRHLKVLHDAKAIRIQKEFIKDKPRTTVFLSPAGLTRFQEYLAALEEVLVNARRAIPEGKKSRTPAGGALRMETA